MLAYFVIINTFSGFRFILAPTKMFNLNNPIDVKKVHQLLFDGSDDEEPSSDSPSGPSVGPPNLMPEVPEEDCDTEAEEEVEVREESSNTEQSDVQETSDSDEGENFFICQRKKGRKIIDSMSWRKTPYPNKKRGKHNLIRRLPGPIGKAKGIQSILETWSCLFDDTMVEQIVRFTNQYIDTIKNNYSRDRDAKHTDAIEIKAFIGLLYIAGVYKAGKINLSNLWSKKGFGIEIFRLTMGVNRFRFLLSSLRFDDRETRKDRKALDRLAPVREIFEKFNQNCNESYHVGEDVTVDEKLEAFRGRCVFIQYIPSKPAKYGIKIFAAVDSKLFYTRNMEIYAGKQPDGPFQVSNKPVDVVQRLVAPLRNSSRNVTADNWFSDINLLRILRNEYGLSYVGTLKKNKWQIPKELKQIKNRQPFSSIFAFSEDGTMVSYVPQNKKNKKNVLLVSSMHMDAEIDEESGEKKKNGNYYLL